MYARGNYPLAAIGFLPDYEDKGTGIKKSGERIRRSVGVWGSFGGSFALFSLFSCFSGRVFA